MQMQEMYLLSLIIIIKSYIIFVKNEAKIV